LSYQLNPGEALGMEDTPIDPDNRALWDLWKMLERLQDLLARGIVLASDPPPPEPGDTRPFMRRAGE
jgi:hypothetical protein